MTIAAVPTSDNHEVLRLVDPVSPGSERGAAAWPAPLTPLVGRGQEIDELLALLQDDAIRLVTLTGPGGVGKTRLALAAVDRLGGRESETVVFVSLASILDPALVPSVIAGACGVRESGDRPLIDRLRLALHSWHGLLILDNFEQVVAAAPLVSDLLTSCPGVRALVTSRAVLRISGEREFVVTSLDVPSGQPSPAEAVTSAAVVLFVQRAKAVRSGFTLTPENVAVVVEICRQLDGLPLALELAAARIKVLSPAALLARLNHRLHLLTSGLQDQPARHQTIRAAIAWSHDLLTEEEQVLFRRLSVFVGGFTLEAAEAVAWRQEAGVESRESHDPAPHAVLDGIASLVDKSLLGHVDGPNGELRFALLETVREFGLECLTASGEDAEVRRRHARHFLTLAEEAQFSSASVPGPWLVRLQDEHANCRLALEQFVAVGDVSSLLRMAGALGWFWHIQAQFTEGVRWLEEALRRDDGTTMPARAKALLECASMKRFRGESEQALAMAEESLSLYRAAGDEAGIAEASAGLGFFAYGAGDHARTARLGEEVLQIQRRRGQKTGISVGLTLLGIAAIARGDLDRAVTYLEEALVLQRAVDDRFWIAHSLSTLGYVFLALGDHARSAETLRESLVINWQIGSKAQAAWSLFFLALLANAQGNPKQAARLIGAETALRTAVGAFIPPVERKEHERVVADLRGRLSTSAFEAAHAAGERLPFDEAVAEALAVSDAQRAMGPRKTVASPLPFNLTEREIEVLQLIVTGLSDREIGDALFISPRTAQKHAATIFGKLGVNSRTAAATAAIRAGIVPDGEIPAAPAALSR